MIYNIYNKMIEGGMKGMLAIWIIISAVALLIDVITSVFLFVWFTVGGIGAIVAYTMGCSTIVQIIVFCILSAVSLAIGYPFMRHILKKTVTKTMTMEESYIGRTFIIKNDVDDKGRTKYDGIYWTVKNYGEAVKKGDKVKITGIEGNAIVIQKEKSGQDI